MSSSKSIAAKTNRLQGKVALVTGAGTGIGAAAAIRFAAEGASVVLVGRRVERLNQVAKQIQNEFVGAQTLVISADVSLEASNKQIVEDTVRRFGRLDIAFNNAGIGGSQRSFAEADGEQHSQIFRTNVDSVFYALKHQLPAMASSGGGSIINNSSVVGLRAIKGPGPSYIASKFAVNGLTQAAAIEGAQQKVRVNAVAPGIVFTEILGTDAAAQGMLKEYGRTWLSCQDHISSAVQPTSLLLGEQASTIHGVNAAGDKRGLVTRQKCNDCRNLVTGTHFLSQRKRFVQQLNYIS